MTKLLALFLVLAVTPVMCMTPQLRSVDDLFKSSNNAKLLEEEDSDVDDVDVEIDEDTGFNVEDDEAGSFDARANYDIDALMDANPSYANPSYANPSYDNGEDVDVDVDVELDDLEEQVDSAPYAGSYEFEELPDEPCLECEEEAADQTPSVDDVGEDEDTAGMDVDDFNGDLEQVRSEIKQQHFSRTDQATLEHDMDVLEAAAGGSKGTLSAVEQDMAAVRSEITKQYLSRADRATLEHDMAAVEAAAKATASSADGQDKVTQDVEAIRRKVEHGKFSQFALEEIENNLDGIQRDVNLLQSTEDPVSRKQIERATNLRMRALEQEVTQGRKTDVSSSALEHIRTEVAHSRIPTSARKEIMGDLVETRVNALRNDLHTPADTDASRKLMGDATRLSSAMAQMHLSPKIKAMAADNLAGIKNDINLLASVTGHRHNDVAKALELRTTAMRQMFGREGGVATTMSSTNSVRKDVENIRKSLDQQHLSAGVKREVNENLHALEEDARRFDSATDTKKAQLKKAMSYRMKILNDKLQ